MNVIHKNVLVKIPKKDEKVNGVYIPQEEQIVKRRGVVVRYGEAVPKAVKTLLNAEPTIEYNEFYDGGKFTIDGQDYLVMSYESILIIL